MDHRKEHGYYMVRAMDQSPAAFDVFFSNEVVAVGWSEVPFCDYDDVEALVRAVQARYYRGKDPRIVGRKCEEVRRFVNMQDGDRIVVPCHATVRLALARSERIYDPALREYPDLSNQRRVSYVCQEDGETVVAVPRSQLTEKLQIRVRLRGSAVLDLSEFGEEIERLFEGIWLSQSKKLLIDPARFAVGHRAFLADVHARSGKPFQGFRRGFLYKSEVEYKEKAFYLGRTALQLDHWHGWTPGEGHILQAVRAACHPSVSNNLLEHRWAGSAAALRRVQSPEQVAGLERELRGFLTEPTTPEAVGPRFDAFAAYLRRERLGCKWRFLAYLLFLLDREYYFPILPNTFQCVLDCYGISVRVPGQIRWEVYRTLMDVEAEVRAWLTREGYEQPGTIKTQSYLYVVGRALGQNLPLPEGATFDFEQEMNRRKRRAGERERIGLLGERYVLEEERRRLNKAGRPDLARRVRLIAVEDESAGYDLRSFDVNGVERHIEVKTTVRNREADQGFWLTERERMRAIEDDAWCLYRVWSIDDDASHKDLGNIVRDAATGWSLNPASWRATPDNTTGGSSEHPPA